MNVDKNLFVHDFSVVAIMKNEGPYLKEWLNYHMIAGVDHFYLFNNDSDDDTFKIVTPYVNAGYVDLIPLSGSVMQNMAYYIAVKDYALQTRYMAFIDLDEFILPKTGKSIVETVDDIMSQYPATGLAVNWQVFGSSGQKTADFSKGILSRFKQRAEDNWKDNVDIYIGGYGNQHVKTIANPRTISYFENPHYPIFFIGGKFINTNGNDVESAFNSPVLSDKIVINHYHCKSEEEYQTKIKKGRADTDKFKHSQESFIKNDKNEVFDDTILRYRSQRAKIWQKPAADRSDKQLLNAVVNNLQPYTLSDKPKEFFENKVVTFLVCLNVIKRLRDKYPNNVTLKTLEQEALTAVEKSISTEINLLGTQLLLRELPQLLKLPYDTRQLRLLCYDLTFKIKKQLHEYRLWKDMAFYDYTSDYLNVLLQIKDLQVDS